MATEQIEKLLALVLLELAETQSACAELRGLLRGSPLQRDDELHASLSDLRAAEHRMRLERVTAALKAEGLEDALTWALERRME